MKVYHLDKPCLEIPVRNHTESYDNLLYDSDARTSNSFIVLYWTIKKKRLQMNYVSSILLTTIEPRVPFVPTRSIKFKSHPSDICENTENIRVSNCGCTCTRTCTRYLV